MKIFLLSLLVAVSFNGFTQTVVFADPGVGALYITFPAGGTANANNLAINQPYVLNVPLFNSNQLNSIPPLTIRVKIGLGSKMILDPGFNLATAPLSNYFSWSYAVVSGQGTITGDLIQTLPADFNGTASFNVITSILGTSTITANMLIVNNNPSFILSDESSANNFAQLQYTVLSVVPVTFTNLNLIKKGCDVNIRFTTMNEINLDHYEVEYSKDGIHFYKQAILKATQASDYNADLELSADKRATQLFIRIKSVDKDGSYHYSETKITTGICDGALEYNIYPNPLKANMISVLATNGLFNGKYTLRVLDISGRLYCIKEVVLNNTVRYSLPIGNIAAGKYILNVMNANGTGTVALPFEKL